MNKRAAISLLILILLSIAPGRLNAKTLDFSTVDRLTYRCFTEQKWDSVILIGKDALRHEIDYYFLRVRLGIAYYKKTAYFPASVHLRKAREFNAGDAYVADYLYYAYLYTNRVEEARSLKPFMTQPLSTLPVPTTEPAPLLLSQVHLEYGYTFSSDATVNNTGDLMGKDSIYGEEDLYGNSSYLNLGINLRLSKRISISLGYNYLIFNKTRYIQYGREEDHFLGTADSSWGTMYLWSFPFVVHDTNFHYQVKQNEGHLGLTWSLPGGFKIMPAFHLLSVKYPMTSVVYDTNTVSDPGYFTTSDGKLTTFPFTRTNYYFSQYDTSFINYVLALRLTKEIGIFNIGLHGSYSNLNGYTQKQAGLSLTYYPLGNLNLYGTTTLTGFFQKSNNRLLLSQIIGAKLAPWLWLEGNFYYGDYTNANIFNGSVVYNNSDVIDYRAGATILFPVGKHLQFSLIYQYFRKESQQIYYIERENPQTHEIEIKQMIQNNPYNTNTIIGGVTWKL